MNAARINIRIIIGIIKRQITDTIDAEGMKYFTSLLGNFDINRSPNVRRREAVIGVRNNTRAPIKISNGPLLKIETSTPIFEMKIKGASI